MTVFEPGRFGTPDLNRYLAGSKAAYLTHYNLCEIRDPELCETCYRLTGRIAHWENEIKETGKEQS